MIWLKFTVQGITAVDCTFIFELSVIYIKTTFAVAKNKCYVIGLAVLLEVVHTSVVQSLIRLALQTHVLLFVV